MRFLCSACRTLLTGDPGQEIECHLCKVKCKAPENLTAPGAVIGDFAIVRELARGGMGVVYLARQISLDRLVALKILQEKYAADTQFVEDFIREARAAARISHPNIVQAYAVGEENGVYYFAMELIDGDTMKSVLKKEQKIEPRRAAEIIRSVADALDFAWTEQKVVHQDIKPDNIILTRRGQAKLADLGLSRVATGNSLTNDDEDEVMGTPQYISPEQLTGQPTDIRSDLYSLGATFYHLVTGEFPYKGKDGDEIARQHVEGTLRPPIEICPELPAELNRIIVKMMEKNRDARYQSGADLVSDLKNFLQGNSSAPGSSQPVSTPQAGRLSTAAPAGKLNAAPVGKLNAAPAGQLNAAPVGKLNAAPAGQLNAAPAGKLNAAPASKLNAPAEPPKLNATAQPAPAAPKINAPAAPKINAPAAPKISTPAAPKVSAPAAPKVNAPAVPKVNAPAVPKVNAPAVPKVNAPAVPKVSAPAVPKPEAPAQETAKPAIAKPAPAEEKKETPPAEAKEKAPAKKNGGGLKLQKKEEEKAEDAGGAPPIVQQLQQDQKKKPKMEIPKWVKLTCSGIIGGAALIIIALAVLIYFRWMPQALQPVEAQVLDLMGLTIQDNKVVRLGTSAGGAATPAAPPKATAPKLPPPPPKPQTRPEFMRQCETLLQLASQGNIEKFLEGTDAFMLAYPTDATPEEKRARLQLLTAYAPNDEILRVNEYRMKAHEKRESAALAAQEAAEKQAEEERRKKEEAARIAAATQKEMEAAVRKAEESRSAQLAQLQPRIQAYTAQKKQECQALAGAFFTELGNVRSERWQQCLKTAMTAGTFPPDVQPAEKKAAQQAALFARHLNLAFQTVSALKLVMDDPEALKEIQLEVNSQLTRLERFNKPHRVEVRNNLTNKQFSVDLRRPRSRQALLDRMLPNKRIAAIYAKVPAKIRPVQLSEHIDLVNGDFEHLLRRAGGMQKMLYGQLLELYFADRLQNGTQEEKDQLQKRYGNLPPYRKAAGK